MISQLDVDNTMDRKIVYDLLGRKMNPDDDFSKTYGFKLSNDSDSENFDSSANENHDDERLLNDVYDDETGDPELSRAPNIN